MLTRLPDDRVVAWRRGNVTSFLSVLTLAILMALLSVASGQSHASADETEPSESPSVVFLGVPGLRWSDISAAQTPNLDAFVSDAAVAQLSVRSVFRVTCPSDGWLTLGAGRRAASPRVPNIDEEANIPDLNEFCNPVPRVIDNRVEGWDPLKLYNSELSFNAVLGQLGDALAKAGDCATAAGPGAALALADSDGEVGSYIPVAGLVSTEDVKACPLTVIDAATINVRPGRSLDRSEQLDAADAAVGRALSVIPADSTVILGGLANDAAVASLQTLAIRGEGYPPGELLSSSTRLPGLVLLTDLTPTLFSLLGLPPAADFVGAPVKVRASDQTSSERVTALVGLDRKVTVYSDVAPPFFTALVTLQLVLYLAAAIVIRRRDESSPARRRVLRMTGLIALTSAAIPVSTFLANLIPWWTWSHAHTGLVVVVLGIAGLIAALAQFARRTGDLLGEVTVVTVFTSLVLALDVVGVDSLQTASLMGYSPVIAGRLYGFGNVAFALFATSSILATAFVCAPLLRRGRRLAAAWVVVVAGSATLLVDGLPGLGSDFGGMLAIAPAFGVLLMSVLGRRVTWLRFIGLLAAGVVIVMTVATIDWLRPAADQTHLGRFIQQILDGELLDVVSRKLGNNLNVLGSSTLGLLVPFAILFGALVLYRGHDARPAVLSGVFDRVPILRPALAAWLVAMLVGFAVNDSGIAIPAVGIMLAVPILIVISTRLLEEVHTEELKGVGS